MYKNKKVLLIAGGGTLGTYTGKELLRLGAEVHVLCPEEKVSDHPRLRFIRGMASEELLLDIFKENRYNGIVNFIHYTNTEEFKKAYNFLKNYTDHYVFLSSYRVYANEEHPVTEDAPRLPEAIKDPELLAKDTYGMIKAECEDFLRTECKGESWTIVRPVISFSSRRMDIVMNSGLWTVDCARENRVMLLPQSVRELHAGIDWAGNSGKLIANLLFKKDAIGEAFSIYSGHNMTWGEVAKAYENAIGLKVDWVSDEEYFDTIPTIRTHAEHAIMWKYDRSFDRDIDTSKVFRVTGLDRSDFASVEEGILNEMKILEAENEKD